ncbi:MAG: VWA domain-containing protein, partial [Betaproteobacteria bacterium]|nr:VWA domain-containing protein [Betaproteobacteria bacterium]
FNRHWSRRVLGQRARVLLITDGLDRDDTGVLGDEMERLKRSAREIVWLNPLLRYAGFEARAQGPRAILPHVTRHLPVHDLASLEAFAALLKGGTTSLPASRASARCLATPRQNSHPRDW